MKSKEILEQLKEGNQRYVRGQLLHPNQSVEKRTDLKEGQSPEVIVLSCADSRVVPELVFDKGIGDLFVLRVAGNIANTSSIASIEYAVAHLKSSVIIVLGHQNCGAVTAAIGGGDYGKNLNHLLEHIKPAIDQAENPDSIDEVIHLNAKLTAKQLINESEIISEAVNKNQLTIIPAYYHLATGKVDFYI